MSDVFTDKKATVLADKIKEQYQDYLAKSEDKTTSPMREDTFIHGLVAGLTVLKEMNK